MTTRFSSVLGVVGFPDTGKVDMDNNQLVLIVTMATVVIVMITFAMG